MQSSEIKQAVLRTLRERRTVPVGELAIQADEHPLVIARCCDELQEDGYIRQTSSGVYTLDREE